jgi:anti-sigma factor RsiW
MDCLEAQELLSAYLDRELAPAARDAVADHLKGCSKCAATLASFQQLSELSGHLAHPAAPDQWTAIEEQLPTGPIAGPIGKKWTRTFSRDGLQAARPRPFRSRSSRAVAAAMLIVVAGLAIAAYRSWTSRADQHDALLAANFDAFLSRFEQTPEAAEQVLLTSYEGQEVDVPAAMRLVGYRPAITRELPPGYSVEAVYVLDMPCCKCPQAICRRQGGGRIAVFEHDVDQPAWFGDRPAINVQCSGKLTRIVEVDNDLLAATWKSDKRLLTVVGARDIEEVTQLVAHFEGRGEGS